MRALERFTANTTTQLRTSTRTFTYVYICKKQEEIKLIQVCDQDHRFIKDIIWQNLVNIGVRGQDEGL